MQKHLYVLIMFVFIVLEFSCNTKTTQQDTLVQTTSLCTGIASLKGIDVLATPKSMTGIGKSDLSITSTNKEAQAWFNQGLNHLHGFWHLEAYRAFREVIKLDSTCAMGYWGIAMCASGFGGNEQVWKGAIEKAMSLKSKTRKLEQALINATFILITKGIAEAQTPFRQLYKTFPNEPEAIAFAAIILRQHEDQHTQLEIKQLLEESLKKFPNHIGLLHYYLHVMELRPEFAKALPIAERLLKIAPNATHIAHMPGHLYYLAGDYTKAVATYKTTQAKELAYHKAGKIPLASNQNYIHNLQFLTVAQAELNDYKKTFNSAKELSTLTLNSKIPNAGAEQMLLYEGRILPSLVAIRYLHWQDANDELNYWLYTPDVRIENSMVRIYLEAMQAYVQGMEAICSDKGMINSEVAIQKATQKGATLTQLIYLFEQESVPYRGSAAFKSINETFDILSMARYELAGWIDNLDSQKSFNETAWKEAINLQNLIKYDEPPRLMYPIEESLARLHSYRGEKKAMRQAIKDALKRRPHSKRILALVK